jgi:ribonuclease HII
MMGVMAIMGIDEVGRGCWAGPLVAGAVVLADDFIMSDDASWRLADSKVMSKPQRERADEAIRSLALGFGLGWVSNSEVDELGLTMAVGLAMRRAVQAAQAAGVATGTVIIDGKINYLPDMAGSQAVIKADGSVPAVSAASIIAKVARDNWMADIAAKQYPDYGFERHVGYGTKQHQAALAALGVSPLHRRSFRPVKNVAVL